MDEKEEEVRIQDKRRFLVEEGEAKGPSPEQAPGPSPTQEKRAEPEGPGPEPLSGPFPEVTFSSFLLGLSTQALMLMGQIPDPQSGKAHQDLPAARQMIDILGLLKDKTGGNLDKSEQQLMDHILFDLRMKYVELTKQK